MTTHAMSLPAVSGMTDRCARKSRHPVQIIFVYVIHMRENQVPEELIEAWVAEAEAGYDAGVLKRRGRGRPGRGAEPMQVVSVRLTAEELAALDRIVEREHTSRSKAIRQALATYTA